MKRRAILASVGVTSAGVAGCLETVDPRTNGKQNGRRYEACGEPVLVFAKLPTEVQREVRTAFEEGEYSNDGELLYGQVAGESIEALRRNDFYYEAHVNTKLLGGQTLSFTQTSMHYESPVDVEIRNLREDEWRGTVKVTGVDGETHVLEENVTIESHPVTGDKRSVDLDDERIERFRVTDEWGEYGISLRADRVAYDEYDQARADSYHLEGTIGKYAGRYLRIVIDAEGAGFDDRLGGESNEAGNESPERPCLWDEGNEVVMGSAE